MKRKLLFSLLGVATFSFVLLAGCSNTKSNDNQIQDNTTAATETQVTTAAETMTPAANEISPDEATAIAIKDAGFTETQVTVTKIEKEMDDGIWKYDVEFVAGDIKYSYDINLETGAIMEKDTDSIYDD